MERAKLTFEEQMRAQLNESAVTPPPSVWVAIDGQLANDQLADYKKRATVYQWVAAACLALLSISSVYYWNAESDVANSPELISSNVENLERIDNDTPSITEENGLPETTPIESHNSLDNGHIISTNDSEVMQRGLTVLGEKEDSSDPNYEVLSQQRMLLTENQFSGVESKQPVQNSALEMTNLDRIYGVAVLPSAKNTDESYAGLWAGVSVGAGAFNPGFGNQASTASSPLASSDFPESSPNFASVDGDQSFDYFPAGNSVNGGINVGGQVNKWIVLSSGVHYSAFSTGNVESLAYVNNQTNSLLSADEVQSFRTFDTASSVENSNVEVSSVNFNSEFQYVTIPLKAGVILLDDKFNITLNTGISSNFLINAHVQSENLNDDIDNSQNYESVYFNFLGSVEFGYNFMDRYQLSIEPNYNQAISDFTKTNNQAQGRPKNFGVSVGIRYNF